MNKPWLMTITAIAMIFIGTLKSQELCSLRPFIKAGPSLKIQKFDKVKRGLSHEDQELLELWESMLTGRTASLARWMKETYRELGLKHIFTPSGFHLSAVLAPFLKVSKSTGHQLILLTFIGIILVFAPGFGALKRMVLIKGSQKIVGMKSGFIFALLLDICFGSFQHSPLSFSYSFLFLGIIYSGVKGFGLIFWFFFAQIILAFFQANQISPLLLLLSPLLNTIFALIMPFMFILSYPLLEWQLSTGIFILRLVQKLIMLFSKLLPYVPLWEIHIGTLLLFAAFTFRKWKSVGLMLLVLSNSLNFERVSTPTSATNEFRPQGKFIRMRKDVIYYSDGRCKVILVKGHWWEKCSPLRSKNS